MPAFSNIPRIWPAFRSLWSSNIDAVRAIARERARSDFAALAGSLTRRLRDVTDEFLRRENAGRPDYLETIFAPAQVP